MNKSLTWLSLTLLVAGCSSPRSLYYWGNYETVIYNAYSRPEKADPMMQIALMEEDLQKAAAQDQLVGPGFHAQLGHLYYTTGNIDRAREEFQLEKQLFPESTPFMDRLLLNTTK